MNQLGFPILTLMLAIPTIAAAACLFVSAPNARRMALGATLIDLALGILLWATYQTGGDQWQFVEQADLFVSVGTSGAVYPAAGFVQAASAYGARTLELNLVPSEGSHHFDESRHGPAGELVPAWVEELLG